MLDCPLSCHSLKLLGILHEHASDFGILRVFGLGCAEK